MARWVHKIDLKDIFHDENRTFTQRRDEIVRRLRAAKFYAAADDDPDGAWLAEIVDNLEDAEDADQFDPWWDRLYDWADDNRVWVGTF